MVYIMIFMILKLTLISYLLLLEQLSTKWRPLRDLWRTLAFTKQSPSELCGVFDPQNVTLDKIKLIKRDEEIE